MRQMFEPIPDDLTNSQMYFIAEIGANHDGEFSRAVRLVELAAEAGANAVKFQHIRAELLGSRRGFDRLYQKYGNKSQHAAHALDAYAKIEIPISWMDELRGVCNGHGVDLITAPYYLEEIEELAPFVDAFKVGSGDFGWVEKNLKLLETGKPVILATGMETFSSVTEVMAKLENFHRQITLLQCNSNYSVDLENLNHLNLRVIQNYQTKWPSVSVGISDHTKSSTVPILAVALGASVLERHFTDDGGRPGADHRIALEPDGWREMVDTTNEAIRILGSGFKQREPNETYSAMTQRRAIRASVNLREGQVIQRQDVTVLRPWFPGCFEAKDLEFIVGKSLRRALAAGDEIRPEHFGARSN